MFVYEMTLDDVSWGEYLQETYMEAFAGAVPASLPAVSTQQHCGKKPHCSGCCLLAALCGAARRGPLRALPWL